MQFSADEKALALATAFKALVGALLDSDSIDAAAFERHAVMAIERLAALGETGASAAAAEMLEPLLVNVRQRRGIS